MPFIKDLKPQDIIKGAVYLCKFKQLLKNKNGKIYYTVKLQDSTGLIEGKIWSIHAGIEDFEVDDVVQVEGEVILYQESLQLNIIKISKMNKPYDLQNLLPHSKKELNDLENKLLFYIDQVHNNYLKELLETIFYNNTIYDAFITHGGGKSIHHAYLNGLIEHTLCVTDIGIHLAKLYNNVTIDYVIAGCLLHDIGKIRELTDFPKNDYSDEGQLLGHLVIGAEIVHDTAQQIKDFPLEVELILKHILISHHGEYEYGSPKRPKCIEAMIVHLADYTDSRLKMVDELLDNSTEEPYAGYHRTLTRNIRRAKL